MLWNPKPKFQALAIEERKHASSSSAAQSQQGARHLLVLVIPLSGFNRGLTYSRNVRSAFDALVYVRVASQAMPGILLYRLYELHFFLVSS